MDASKRDQAVTQVTGQSQADYDRISKFQAWDLKYDQTHAAAAGEESLRTYNATHRLMLVVVAMALATAALLAVLLIRHISRPLAAMTEAMLRLANREMATIIPCIGRGDEIGSMAGAVQVFKDNMIAADRLASRRPSSEARPSVPLVSMPWWAASRARSARW